MGSCSSSVFLLFFLYLNLLVLSRSGDETTLKGIDLETPVLDVSLAPISGNSETDGSKNVLLCDRIRVYGHSRMNLGSYASSLHVTLAPSAVIPERLHSKIQVCFHRNNSLGWCQCEKDEWRTFHKGIWSNVMSPYEERYVDVRITADVSGTVTIAVEEDSQQWRLICLAVGFVLLLLAPIVSSWVPFYYSSSMAIGVLLVIIILLFQGMKLLPTGRKNVLYLSIYGSVIGAGSFLLHHLSVLVNSMLQSFGLSEEMHNPVSMIVLVLVILAGAGLGYWIVRKFVITKDGTVDAGIAQFVKWAIRIIGATSILQSTHDTPLAIGALVLCCAICSLITSKKWHRTLRYTYSETVDRRQQVVRQVRGSRNRAEFLSRSTPRGKLWNSPKGQYARSHSPVKGLISPSSGTQIQQDYYSTFHNTRNRKKFTKEEWEDFTRESTRQALAEWAATPEFTDWFVEHADRIQLHPSESSDEAVGSESDSTDDVESRNKWFGFSK
ncbi:Nuclear envelope integral membrane protein [Quillaja saponaria]|uniref:Nuclear envelope integral membrane protein n=1 Tax=Quillaja saponaria TaxID=32244 RepID=A0AAD7VDR7_QUISA|nr:Nuclear envelope integral membrane protein [Quillaja saponaria]